MGDIADYYIEQEMFGGDEEVHHYPKYLKQKETEAERNIRTVRKELAILIKKYQEENVHCAVQEARKFINKKYGHGWRERGLCVNSDNQWKPLNEYQLKD